MQQPHWILIANAARARLLQQDGEGGPLVLVQSFEHRASRLRTSELADDQAGRERTDSRFGAVAYLPRLDAHEKEELRFAHELADELEQGAAAGRCETITLFAPPRFLGALRGALHAAAGQRVVAGYGVDITSVGSAELARRIAHEKERAGAA